MAAAALAACGGGTTGDPGDDAAGEGRSVGETTEGDGSGDLAAEAGSEVDGLPPELLPECVGCGEDGEMELPVEQGYFGWPCNTNAECLSGYCIETAQGKQCTQVCVEDCPEGWWCVQDLSASPDVVYVCVQANARLCMPCNEHVDCNPAGFDLGQRCLSYGAAGNYCGSQCYESQGDKTCPAGYQCLSEAPLAEGGPSPAPQCVADEACACSGLAVEKGAWTTCSLGNAFGTCPGEVHCAEPGPAVCDAPAAAAEVCNAFDDDCDAAVDEELGTTTCGLGECEHETANCVEGEPQVCDPFAGAVEQELCDGKDDDCDGLTDEGYPDTCPGGGADCIDPDDDCDEVPDVIDNCPLKANQDQYDCDLDNLGNACDEDDDNDYSPDEVDCAPCDPKRYPGAKEICDGTDNDCDEMLDEGFDTVTCGLGKCKHTVALCDGGEVNGCDPLEGAVDEACDGLDNDCDGSTDEVDSLGCIPYFIDLDKDGAGDGLPQCLCAPDAFYAALEAGDCKPLDPDVFPLAAEACNGKDDNCNALVDEGFDDSDVDGEADCVDPDDDDDKVPDLIDNCPLASNPKQENFDDDQYGDECDWDDDDDESGDVFDCEPFDPAVFPGAVETCNGLDDDCDSAVDEELGAVTCGLGVCMHVVANCIDGAPAGCDPFEGASAEVCDDEDNDCDGAADEALGTTSCGLGICAHTLPTCVDGNLQICDPMEGAADEVCDGQDNDCDGLADEELGQTTCGKGLCLHTVANCKEGKPQSCNPFDGAAEEICDGQDNNCNGLADEELGQTTCGKGLCLHTVANCKEGKPQLCDPLEGAAPKETCDGHDDDCNGQTDDIPELGQACDTGLPGLCAPGITTCEPAGAGLFCKGTVLPGVAQETCANLGADDNCDGIADNIPNLGMLCQNQSPGICAIGTYLCSAGQLTCQSTVQPGTQPEACGNGDEDCDGQIDEPDSLGCKIWYVDADLDGYGVPPGQCLCSQPAGSAAVGTDCNDTQKGINPGAAEICNNDEDENCDGVVCKTSGDKKWSRYRKSDVYQDWDGYMPNLGDFGNFVDSVADAKSFGMSCSQCVEGWRAWAYVAQPKSFPICVWGDDGVSFYRDGQFVAGRPNAESPPSCGTLSLAAGWNKLEGLSFNGPGPGHLDFDVLIGAQVEALNSTQP
jgi:hypothetical protein